MKMRFVCFAGMVLSFASLVAKEPPLERWIYSSTNLQVHENVEDACALFARGAAAGYTHALLADSKFSRLQDVPEKYFAHCAEVREAARKHGIELVPALFGMGYSNDLLHHNPNLAEGLPVRDALFVVKNGEANIAADPPVSLPGGDMENRKKWRFVDDDLVSENGALRATDPKGNARFHQTVKVSRFRQYTLSARIKTQDFTGEPEMKALVPGRPQLSYTKLKAKRTQEWTTHHITFNSLDHDEVGIYIGTWGAAKGTIWWDDAEMHEEGLVNVLRRDGCPLVVKTEDGRALQEGADFDAVSDPRMGNQPYAGSYEVWHEPPPIKTKQPDGTRLRVSFYHPHIIYDEQVCICPSEPKTVEILCDQAAGVHAVWNAGGYMMQHDEWRVLGLDEACQRRGLPAGQLIADNVRTCQDILAKTAPGARIYVWSDMFDPFHNALENYYLTKGDLRGSWDGLASSVVLVNWNSGKPDKSLPFFAGRGHAQILAGFYDSDPTKIKSWMAAAKGVQGIVGVMYTTWRKDYSQLEAFSKAVSEAEAGR